MPQAAHQQHFHWNSSAVLLHCRFVHRTQAERCMHILHSEVWKQVHIFKHHLTPSITHAVIPSCYAWSLRQLCACVTWRADCVNTQLCVACNADQANHLNPITQWSSESCCCMQCLGGQAACIAKNDAGGSRAGATIMDSSCIKAQCKAVGLSYKAWKRRSPVCVSAFKRLAVFLAEFQICQYSTFIAVCMTSRNKCSTTVLPATADSMSEVHSLIHRHVFRDQVRTVQSSLYKAVFW